jgi:sulfite exporter TauE/SafE
MLAFGLGTFPAMLALGSGRALLRPRWRAHLSRLAGVLVVGFGLLTLLRGILPATMHVH